MIDEVNVNGVVHKINDTEARKEIEKKLEKPINEPIAGKILAIKEVNEDGTFTCEWAEQNKSGISNSGHWETVMDIVWDFNDYIHVVSYDSENHIFTCNTGELDWANVGERLAYALLPVCDTNICKTKELPFNQFRKLSGVKVGGFIGGFVKLTDTTFAFKDLEGNIVPVPNEETMNISKFHFEHLENRTISNLNCTKARYILTDLIAKIDAYSSPATFNKMPNTVSNYAFTNGWNHKSFTKSECEIVGNSIVQNFRTIQTSSDVGTYAVSSVKEGFGNLKSDKPKIDSLYFMFGWNEGASVPRNGSLFKLERWVE